MPSTVPPAAAKGPIGIESGASLPLGMTPVTRCGSPMTSTNGIFLPKTEKTWRWRPLRGGRSGDIVPRPSRLVPRRLYYSLEDAIEAAESEYAAVVVAVEVTVKEQITRTTTCRQ